MLSPDLQLRELDPRQWANWWRLLVPPRVLDRSSSGPRWALVVLDDGLPIKVITSGVGALVPIPALAPIDPTTPGLAAWARQLDVAAVIAVERTLIGALSAEIEAALSLDQDYAAQGIIALRALKRWAGKGLWTEPPLLDVLPTPSYEGLQRTFDLLVPDRSALLAYVIDDDRARIHSSIIAVKQAGDVTVVATHRALVDLVPEATFSRTWDTTGYKRVLDAVEDRFAKPSIGVFLERAAVQRIITGPSDQFARELNAKHVIIEPSPAWLLGLVGGATIAAMAGRAARGFAAMLPQGTRDRAAAMAQRAGTALKESGPFAQLGFDPLELWSRLRHFYRA
ncbi:MAG: hypothetical protein NT062_35010 [Proteobacteria bacterium]|nr:hypothetical protein [Pseudomonadota bacterium]